MECDRVSQVSLSLEQTFEDFQSCGKLFESLFECSQEPLPLRKRVYSACSNVFRDNHTRITQYDGIIEAICNLRESLIHLTNRMEKAVFSLQEWQTFRKTKNPLKIFRKPSLKKEYNDVLSEYFANSHEIKVKKLEQCVNNAKKEILGCAIRIHHLIRLGDLNKRFENLFDKSKINIKKVESFIEDLEFTVPGNGCERILRMLQVLSTSVSQEKIRKTRKNNLLNRIHNLYLIIQPPAEIYSHIFSFLETRDLRNLAHVSKHFRKIVIGDVAHLIETQRQMHNNGNLFEIFPQQLVHYINYNKISLRIIRNHFTCSIIQGCPNKCFHRKGEKLLKNYGTELKYLSFSSTNSFSDLVDRERVFMQFLNSCPYLEEIHFGLKIPNFVPSLIDAKCVTHLKALTATHNEINKDDFKALVGCLDSENLQTLNLSNNHITSGLENIARFTNLQFLHLNSNMIQPHELKAIIDLRNLKSLHLQWNFLRDQGISYLTSPQANLKSLVDLRLGACRLTNKAVQDLVTSPLSKQLKYLNLKMNEIGPEGAILLAAADFPRLKVLKLKLCSIQDSGAIALANSKLIRQLKKINVRHTGMEDPGALAIAKAVANSKKLKRLSLGGSRISMDMQNQIKQLFREAQKPETYIKLLG